MTYSKNVKSHPKWNSLIEKIADDVMRICEEISRTGKPDWNKDVKIANNTKKKKFTWVAGGTGKSAVPRKKRRLFNMKVE